MIKITFNLDRAFKPGTDMQSIKELKAQGKPITKYFNPKSTPIYMWISSLDFKHFKIHTGMRILPAYWDFNKKEVKYSCANHIEMNLRLSKLDDGIQSVILNRQINGETLHLEDIKQIVQDQILGIKPVMRTTNFLDLIDEFIDDRKHGIKSNTSVKYTGLKKVLETFIKTQNYALTLSRIDYDFEKSFKGYLIGKGRAVNTVSKYFECLKALMRWARKKGYHKDNRFEDFKSPRFRTEKAALGLRELKVLLNLNIDDKKERLLAITRDFFCYQLLTGQRFGDVQNMQWNNIIAKDENTMQWKLFQQKSDKKYPVTIPLHSSAIKIIEKYRRKDWDGKIFPHIANGTINRLLKVLSERAEINDEFSTVHYSGTNRREITGKKWQFITTHTARRSFVTITMELGMDPEAIMRITGHTKYDVMKQYMKMDNTYQIDQFNSTWGNVDLNSDTKKIE
jgi:integrase